MVGTAQPISKYAESYTTKLLSNLIIVFGSHEQLGADQGRSQVSGSESSYS